MKNAKSIFLLFLPLLVIPFILLSPVIFTGKALYWGTPILQFIPWRFISWEMISNGVLPLWNPYLGMGAPLLANYQSALLYPPNWFLFLLAAFGDVGWLAWGHGLLVAIHLAWAGLGMGMLARKLGISPPGQVVSGLAFGLSGYLVGRASFFSINSAVAWMPWIVLYCFENIPNDAQRPFKRKTLLLTLTLAMQLLAGHAQIFWYTLLLALILSGYVGWVRNKEIQRFYTGRIKKNEIVAKFSGVVYIWGIILVAVLFACALTSIQLLPTIEYLLESQRSAAVDFEFAMTYSFWPWRFVTLFAPEFFGSPVTNDYWGYGNYWEDHLYLGLLPLLLGLGSIFIRREVQIENHTNYSKIHFFSLRWVLFCLIVLSFLLALGKNTSLFPWLYRHIFSFNLFQAPTRFSIWAEFSFSLLAGYGFTYWKKPEGKVLYWARLATAGAFAITIGAGLTWYFMGEISPTFIRAAAKTGLLGVACGALWLLLPLSENEFSSIDDSEFQCKHRIWTLGVICFISFDLLLAGWGMNPGKELDIYRWKNHLLIQSQGVSIQRRLYLPVMDEYELKYQQHFRFSSFDSVNDLYLLRQQMLPNVNLLDRVISVNNYDPLVPARYDRWMTELDQMATQGDGYRLNRLLNLSGIGVVEKRDDTKAQGVRYEQIQGSKRVRWVNCVHPVKDSDEALHRVINSTFDFDQWVVVEGLDKTDYYGCVGNPDHLFSEARIALVSEKPNSMIINVESPKDGWLVISDVWYPGWIAKIDNVKTKIFRANYLFRGVYVNQGVHSIQFVYAPGSFFAGSVISLLSVLTLIFLWKRNSGNIN